MNTAIPATLGAFGQILDTSGVPTAFDAPSVLSYAPSGPTKAAPPPAPLQNIRRKLLAAQIARSEQTRTANLYSSLPMITEDIAKANADKAAAFETIERAKQAIMAPPPEAPTHPEANWQETLAGIAALVAGGGAGASRVVGDTLAVAQARQSNEFANKFREYQARLSAARMDYAAAREDEARAQNRGDLFTREFRDSLQRQQDAETAARAHEADRLDAWDRMNAGFRHDDARQDADFTNKVNFEQYRVALDRETDRLRRAGDAASKDRASAIEDARKILYSGTPGQVEAAAHQLGVLGFPMDGRTVAEAITSAQKESARRAAKDSNDAQKAQDAHTAAVDAHDNAGAGTQIAAGNLAIRRGQIYQETGVDPLPGGIGGKIGMLPTTGGATPLDPGALPGGVSLQPIPFGGTKATKAARIALETAQGEHDTRTASSPWQGNTDADYRRAKAELARLKALPDDDENKPDAAALKVREATLDKMGAKYDAWKKDVDASATKLNGLRNAYFSTLTPDDMKDLRGFYDQVRDQIATNSKQAKANPAAAATLNAQSKAIRDAFQRKYGLSVDWVQKKVGR